MSNPTSSPLDDLIDATLAVAELAEAETRLRGTPVTPAFEQEFDGANDRLGSLLAWYLRHGHYCALDATVRWFSAPEQALAQALLSAALQFETTSAVTDAGNRSEALLMPLLMPAKLSDALFPAALAAKYCQVYRGHYPENSFVRVTVSPFFLDFDEVRGWSYPDIYELNIKSAGADLSRLAFRRVLPPAQSHGGSVLRFLLVHRETSASCDAGQSGGHGGHRPPCTPALAQALKALLSDAYGEVIVCKCPLNVYGARKLGRQLCAPPVAGGL